MSSGGPALLEFLTKEENAPFTVPCPRTTSVTLT